MRGTTLMKPYPWMPGVPAAGHIAANGYWHPGRIDGCPKCPQPQPPREPRRPREDGA